MQDQRIVTDSRSIFGPENTSFREHRHDQSLLSIVLFKYNICLEWFEKGILQNLRALY